MNIYPLTPEQRYFYDCQNSAPDSVMCSYFPYLGRLKDCVNIERFADCLMKTLHVHPAHLTVIEERGGIPFHNIICDGFGKILFRHDLQKIYDGQDIAPDSWFAYLEEREAEKSSPHYEAGGQGGQGLLSLSSGLNDDSFGALRHWNLTRTEFFLAVSLLAIAEYNLNPSVLITWCSKGRWKREYRRSTGMMKNKYAAAENILDVEARETDSGIDILFVYDTGRYKPESIERFAGLYVRILHDALRRVNADA